TGYSNLHCTPSGYCPNAAHQISCLYIPRVLAVVLWLGMAGHEAGRELAGIGGILSQIPCRGSGCHCAWSGLVRVDTLAEPNSHSINAPPLLKPQMLEYDSAASMGETVQKGFRIPVYRRPEPGTQPARPYEPYKSTVLRNPSQPLI